MHRSEAPRARYVAPANPQLLAPPVAVQAAVEMAPPNARKLPPEQLVDGARGTHGLERRHWCSMIAASPDARTELELIAAFEEDLEGTARGRAVAMRLDVAIEGALATLDEQT